MSVSRIFSGSSSASVRADSPAGAGQSFPLTAALGLSRGVIQANIARGAKTMGRLATLAKTDPERFKLVAQGIADRLGDKAQEPFDAAQGEPGVAAHRQLLARLAARFSDAAGTGSLESLRPCAGAQEEAAGDKALAQLVEALHGPDVRRALDCAVADALADVGPSDPALPA